MKTVQILNQLLVPKQSILLLAIWIPYFVMGQEQSKGLSSLNRMNVNRKFITLSGFSSGGTFAQQLYFSYSSLIHGIAVFSHTYFRCGPVTNLQRVYDSACTTQGNRRHSELYDPNFALSDIQNYYKAGLIENPRNMANKPLYVFAGTRNWLFTTDMSLRILQIFEPYIKNLSAIKTRVSTANLTLPSDRPGLPSCGGPPNAIAVSNCGFSGALDSLQFLLGKAAVQRPSHHQLQPLITFDQTEFFYGIEETGRHDMDDVGFMYIPTVCQDKAVLCYVHFYFHGCMTGRQFVGANHILNSGFLEVGEENGIIMIFPQVVSAPVENQIGCWDTYGFTGPLYATKRGGQVTVVRNMLSRILGEDSIVFDHGNVVNHEHVNTPITPMAAALQKIESQQLHHLILSNPYENTRARCTQFSCTLNTFY